MGYSFISRSNKRANSIQAGGINIDQIARIRINFLQN